MMAGSYHPSFIDLLNHRDSRSVSPGVRKWGEVGVGARKELGPCQIASITFRVKRPIERQSGLFKQSRSQQVVKGKEVDLITFAVCLPAKNRQSVSHHFGVFDSSIMTCVSCYETCRTVWYQCSLSITDRDLWPAICEGKICWTSYESHLPRIEKVVYILMGNDGFTVTNF